MNAQEMNNSGYIKSINDGVLTVANLTAGASIAVLNMSSNSFQKWKFTNEGYIILETSSSLEFCLSTSNDLSSSGDRVYLEPKGTSGFLQKWGYDKEKMQYYLIDDQDYLLSDGSGGAFGPIVYVSKGSDSRWSLPVD